MTKPRLLHILGDSKFGGDSVLVIAMGRAAVERGYEVDVLATHSVVQDEIRQAGLGLVDLDVVRRDIRPLWDGRGMLQLHRYLKDVPYSIVHTHGSKPGLVARFAARRAGVRGVIHTAHGFAFHEESGRAPTVFYSGIERVAARWCDRIVTVSEYHRRWALRLGIGKPDQVVAIPNGLPPERVHCSRTREAIRAELGVSDSFVVLSTGRLSEQKGIEYLIRAVPLVPDGDGALAVLLAGDGPLGPDLESLTSELGLDDRVRFLGFRRDIGDLLAAADLVVFPSLWEGLSVSLLEAMAAARPIITTRIGSNVEVTRDGEGACLIPSKDPASLADAIRTLTDDDALRDRLSRRAYDIWREHYTVEPMLEAYLSEYQALLSQAE